MRKIIVNDIECCFYENNIRHMDMILLTYANQSITTRDMKRKVEIVLDILNIIVAEEMSEEDLNRYQITIKVFKTLDYILGAKNIRKQDIKKEYIKIAIDVLEEIALIQTKNSNERQAIKIVSMLAKISI